MTNEPDFNEEDIQESIMDKLPEGGEKLPLQNEQKEIYNALEEMFNRARDF